MRPDDEMVPFDAKQSALRELSREASICFLPETQPDWDAIETRILREPPKRRWGRIYPVLAFVGGFAAAASAVLFLRGSSPGTSTQPIAGPEPIAKGATLDSTKMPPSASRYHVLGRSEAAVVVAEGRPLTDGDSIEEGTRVRVERGRVAFARSDTAQPAIVWLAEEGAVVKVGQYERAPELVLETGTVEADVIPAPKPVAFSVLSGDTRVAVRGTHFRVARDQTGTTVDVQEGTVSVTSGGAERLAKAPMRVFVGVEKGPMVDLTATMVAPLWMRGVPDLRSRRELPPALAWSGTRAAKSAPPSASVALALGTPSAAGTTTLAIPAASPSVQIASAVAACAKQKSPTGQAVRTSLQSTLTVDVGEDGSVKMAVFAPPLPPEIQSCAANTIYAVRFPSAGTVSIPIRVE